MSNCIDGHRFLSRCLLWNGNGECPHLLAYAIPCYLHFITQAGPPTAIKASNASPMSPKGLQSYSLSLKATRTSPVSRDVFLTLLCPHHFPPFHGGHSTGGTSYIRWYCNFHCQARQLFPRWPLTVCEPGPELDRVGIVFRIVVDF